MLLPTHYCGGNPRRNFGWLYFAHHPLKEKISLCGITDHSGKPALPECRRNDQDGLFFKMVDATDLIESGNYKNLILIAAVIFLIVGIVSFSYAVPRLGIQSQDSFLKRAALFHFVDF